MANSKEGNPIAKKVNKIAELFFVLLLPVLIVYTSSTCAYYSIQKHFCHLNRFHF